MARSYAQFSTSMWRNTDFLALPSGLQRVYMMLSSQADVSAVGVLHLSVTRWAGRAPDTTVGDINRALDGLAERRFIILDRDSEEVLLRAFLRWDNGYKNPKRQPAIRDAANDVESPAIVTALAVEFERIDMPARYRGQCVRVAPEPPAAVAPEPDDESAFPQVDSLSIAIPDSEEGVSRSERRVPQPPTRNPQPVPPSAGAASAPPDQAAFDGMPEPDTPPETPEQIGFRLARRWKKIRDDAKKPIIARGSRKAPKNPDHVIWPLKSLIEGAIGAGYSEDEINRALERCNQGIPSATAFDKAIELIRDEANGSAVVPYNTPHVGGSPTYSAPTLRRSTSVMRAEQGMAVADALDRKFGHGKYATEGAP